jgi:hypothetical protein
MSKKRNGQFYTVNSAYILQGLPFSPDTTVVEPFAGQGDLLTWLGTTLPVEAYDIEPKHKDVVQRDTLLNPPSYADKWVLTNPPYLARNKCEDKVVFDKYETNDLYKCFLLSLQNCKGGIIIIPAGFFFSPRAVDVHVRNTFMTNYRVLKVNYFEETVFPDTTTTVVAIAFEKAQTPLTVQHVPWVCFPCKKEQTFTMSKEYDWIIGGEMYSLPSASGIKVSRYVEGKSKEGITSMTLNALDSGTQQGRIQLEYKPGFVYPAKECSRTYATLCLSGISLSEEKQKELCKSFNALLEEKRRETWSLFLPQYRESKEYARKRIPFELAYTIVLHLLLQ